MAIGMLRRNSGGTAVSVLHGRVLSTRRLSSVKDGSRFVPAEPMTLADVNENVIKAKYAVRGKIPTRAEELERRLEEQPGSLPFSKIIQANIGNPQQLGQKPLTFYRQVLSLMQNPQLLEMPAEWLQQAFKEDVVARARRMLQDAGGSVGAYSASQGVKGYRCTVAQFIENRDGIPANPDNVYLTAGASSAVASLLSTFCKGPETGVLIPIPQYPLYTATITRNNAVALPYYLNEADGWSTNPEEMERVILESKKKNITPKCLVVINPGNPTGSVLSVKDMEAILTLAAKYGIVVIADEVYQDNVFGDAEFHSMRKVLKSLQRKEPALYKNVQLASLHSISKGLSGECGQRGGYMELLGFREEIRKVFVKLASISLCPVVTGQALVDLMVGPPSPGDPSYEQYTQETKSIYHELQERSQLLWKTFCSLEGIECNMPQGALYLFPKLHLPQKAIEAAQKLDIPADEFYCRELLDETGICTVPGTGFGQMPGTYHVRTTFLPPGTEWIESWKNFHKKFYDKYRD
ncbi:AaceriAGR085Wp [[Ashbya] aceris (nom. inval.)]|nr:AaceriAGR085Wp [[Ashbya] aceris (nom. inval.)]